MSCRGSLLTKKHVRYLPLFLLHRYHICHAIASSGNDVPSRLPVSLQPSFEPFLAAIECAECWRNMVQDDSAFQCRLHCLTFHDHPHRLLRYRIGTHLGSIRANVDIFVVSLTARLRVVSSANLRLPPPSTVPLVQANMFRQMHTPYRGGRSNFRGISGQWSRQDQ